MPWADAFLSVVPSQGLLGFESREQGDQRQASGESRLSEKPVIRPSGQDL
jgi:hypothetical protein